ncbi:uncharacterized protein MISP3 [Pelobates fuscus]|uniref:uncharacterized protein MISP3 n=1 Tax=Pelobates fuscus TaxID=191477 RepID=UPI002FE431B7
MASEKQHLDVCPSVTDGPVVVNQADTESSHNMQGPQVFSEDSSLKLSSNCTADSEHQGAAEHILPTQKETSVEEPVVIRNEQVKGEEGDNNKEQIAGLEANSENQTIEQEEGTSNNQETIGADTSGNNQEVIQVEARTQGQDGASDQNSEWATGPDQDGATGEEHETGHGEQIAIKEQEKAKLEKQEGISREEHATDTQETGTFDREPEQVKIRGEGPDVGGDGARSVETSEGETEAVKRASEEGEKSKENGQAMGEPGGHGGSCDIENEGERTELSPTEANGEHTEQQITTDILETATGDKRECLDQNVRRGGSDAQLTGDTGEGKDGQTIGTPEDVPGTCVKETGAQMKEAEVNEAEEARVPGEHGTSEDVCSEAQVTAGMIGADIQVTAEETGEKVTAQGTAADGHVIGKHIQLAEEETVTSIPVTGERIDTETHADVQVTGTVIQPTGDNSAVIEDISSSGDQTHELSFASTQGAVEEFTGAQKTNIEVKVDIAGEFGAGGQVSTSGEKAEREVTPDPASVPGWEGTNGTDRPAACWEKECPSLTGREEKVDTAGQGETQEEKATEKELSCKTAAMKDREFVEVGEIPPAETPIEREIRLTMERENILRQERGISSPVGQSEFVEVRRRTLSVEVGLPAGKERQLAGAQMQRDIQQETRREQDLVELGKVMGTYDRGPQQELQERKQLFENFATVPSEPPSSKRQSTSSQIVVAEVPVSVAPAIFNNVAPSAPNAGVKKGPSFTEANGSNVILIEHSSILQRSAPVNYSVTSAPADLPRPADVPRLADLPRPAKSDSPQPAPGSPYQILLSPSPRSLLEKEIEEVKERERELRRQRSSVYGRDEILLGDTEKKSDDRGEVLSGIYQPERPSWRKLEVNWPPNPEVTMNGQQSEQTLDSPRTRRQRSSLFQSWEAGTPNPLEE